jgi:hypothetical protein
MNTLGYIALAAAFGALFGKLPALINKVKEIRQRIKNSNQLSVPVPFEWTPAMQATLDRLKK